MTSRLVLALGSVLPALATPGGAVANDFPAPAWVADAHARTVPSRGGVYPVDRFGGKPDGVTAALFIKSHVHFSIPAGTTLLGSQDEKAYPIQPTRVAGIEMDWPAALINVRDESDVLIDGGGTIDGRGKLWWDKYWALRKIYTPKGLRWASDYDAQRVRLLLVSSSRDVTLAHLHLRRAGFWTVQLLYSDHLTVAGITISDNAGPSTDGVDVDSSRDVEIAGCDIDNNDDDIVLKSGRDSDGLRVNRPTEYIFIHDNLTRRGAGMVTIGSETSGWVRHVYARHNRANGTSNGVLFKSAHTRGGGASDIVITDAEMINVPRPFSFTLDWNPAYSYATIPAGIASIPPYWKILATPVPPAQGLADFHDITLAHIRADGARRILSAEGMPQRPLGPVHWVDVSAVGETAGTLLWTNGWTFDNVTFAPADGKPLHSAHNQLASALPR